MIYCDAYILVTLSFPIFGPLQISNHKTIEFSDDETTGEEEQTEDEEDDEDEDLENENDKEKEQREQEENKEPVEKPKQQEFSVIQPTPQVI